MRLFFLTILSSLVVMSHQLLVAEADINGTVTIDADHVSDGIHIYECNDRHNGLKRLLIVNFTIVAVCNDRKVQKVYINK